MSLLLRFNDVLITQGSVSFQLNGGQSCMYPKNLHPSVHPLTWCHRQPAGTPPPAPPWAPLALSCPATPLTKGFLQRLSPCYLGS